MTGCIILRIKLGKNNDISPIPSIIKINGDTIIPINIVDNDIFLNRFIIIEFNFFFNELLYLINLFFFTINTIF